MSVGKVTSTPRANPSKTKSPSKTKKTTKKSKGSASSPSNTQTAGNKSSKSLYSKIKRRIYIYSQVIGGALYKNTKAVCNEAYKLGKPVLTNKYVRGIVAAGAALLTGYSILKDGYEKGLRNSKERLGEYYADIFASTNSSPRYSHLFEDMRGPIINFKSDETIYPGFVKIKNIASSIIGEIPNNLLSIVLIAGASVPFLFKKVKTGITLSAICTGLLLAEGAKNFAMEFFNVGKKSL